LALEAPADGILSDLRVLDLTVALAGPFCTLNLAGMGAEVIKIEAPGGGDIARWNPPYVGPSGVHFGRPEGEDMSVSMMNRARNKKSITLDLKSERGHEVFLALARHADVVVENFSEGTAERLGVGYDAVREVNPRIVYCSISGLGQHSAQPELKSMDIIVQALSGIMDVTGFADGPPVRVGVPVGDLTAPLYATSGILAALWYRERTGRGQHLDVSLVDCLSALVAEEHFDVFEQAGFPSRNGNFHARLTPFGVYRASDGYVAIGAVTDRWAALLFEAMGQPQLAADPRFAERGPRAANSAALNEMIEAWTSTLTRDELVDVLFEQRRVPAVRVRGPREMIEDEQLLARGAVVPLEHPTLGYAEPVKGSGLPIRFSEGHAGFDRPSPVLGQHNEDVYGTLLGLDAAQLEALRGDGVI
jgi:crotonobetainyl-CoA:carnitine CoA-transferase CaiB-like acyl-CoA transferase